MKPLLPSLAFAAALLGNLLFNGTLVAQIPTFASADLVLGQTDFVSDDVPGVPTSQSLNSPVSVATDPTTGKVFVADAENHRILRYGTAAALANGAAAEAVFGQVDFSEQSENQGGVTSANSLSYPRGMIVDAAGRLWVADTFNDRVLMYPAASTQGSNPAAVFVLGQPDFTSGGAGTTATSMNLPEGLWLDAEGTLWVVERNNHRVLRFDNVLAKLDGAAADGVLGQVDFVSSVEGTSATQLRFPYGVTMDAAGTLWVGDRSNNRVVGFENAAGLANGAAATRVLGQSNFISSFSATSSLGMDRPRSVDVDPFGALWVYDSDNNRLLRFDDVVNKEDGAAADALLGQASFLDSGFGLAANRLHLQDTAFLHADAAGNIWVADVNNNRVLRFTRPPTVVVDTTRPVIKVRGRKTIETLRKRVVFRGTATDASGIGEIQVKTRKGAEVRKVKLLSRDRWKAVLRVTKDRGRVVVKFRAVDEAGNRSGFKRVRILRR